MYSVNLIFESLIFRNPLIPQFLNPSFLLLYRLFFKSEIRNPKSKIRNRIP